MKKHVHRLLVAASVCGLSAIAVPGYAAEAKVTFHEHVAPILRANCVTCHQPVGLNLGSLKAPMSLTTFEEVRPWARAIARKVQGREMPPWFAEEPKGVFSNERGLTDRQIATIVAWVESGAAAGDRSKAPAMPAMKAPPAENAGYTLGKPDLIVKMDPYFLTDDGEDVQGTFHTVIPDGLLPKDVLVRAWEFRAGTYKAADTETVHHVCGGVRPPGFVANPAADADGEAAAGLSLGCIAGGAEPMELPEGYGLEVKKGSTVTFNMHYYKTKGPGTGFWNQAEIGFYFAKGPIRYRVQSKAIGGTGFEIPPNKVGHRVGAAETLERDTLFLSYWPHAHLRAVTARYTATYPDGRTEVLLDVPRYDQSWQVTYKLKQPKLLPKGTRIDYEMTYDNSPARAVKRHFNPNDTVRNGARTQDEMMLGFMSYAEVEPSQGKTTQQQDQ